MTIMREVGFGLGANLGDKAGHVREAAARLARSGLVESLELSSLWRTPPWGKTDQDWFVNACALVVTKLTPHELLKRCQAVENAMGRVREERWGPRIVDVDVLTYRGQTIDTPDLKVPHPYIEQRAFVVLPLLEIAPGEKVRGRTIREIAATLDAGGVTAL